MGGKSASAVVCARARSISAAAWWYFAVWTAFWWGLVGLWGGLFFLGYMGFVTSAKLALYGVSIWLNAWVISWWLGTRNRLPKLDLYHDCLSVWLLCYGMTNLLWEVPWVLLSPHVFINLNTLDDVVAHTEWMRESLCNMWWWVLASFSSCDLRTVNHDGSFYSVEIFCFTNVLSTAYFFYLNRKRSPNRYLVPVVFCGQPIAATFIFTFAEVFNNFKNMPGGVADTLLALVWTQYQYFFFPMIIGAMGVELLREDWCGKASE
mmetsp:Transcript_83434/g.244622  ORF Transcript_83434/g.244622 Transcript_83434/m.244622 type:complete len:263 (-) Transcript_83434:121-909(-)